MYWLLIFLVGIVLLLLLRRVLFPGDRSNAARLMNTYRVMTRELLDSTPDDQLVKAIAANLLAKAEDANTDAYAVIPALSQERCAVYSIWLFLNELRSDDPTTLRRSGQFGFSELAADGLDLLGFETIAEDLRDYLQTADHARVTAMLAAVQNDRLEDALVEFIRDHVDEFCDKSAV